MSRTGSGMGIHRSRETSCSMMASGKIAASDSGRIGFPSGPSGGAGGLGMSATTLYQWRGMSDSSRKIFTCDIGFHSARLSQPRNARLFFGAGYGSHNPSRAQSIQGLGLGRLSPKNRAP